MTLRNENPTTTDRLQEVLKSTHPEDIDTYLKENRDKLLREERPFYAFMKKQFREKGFRQQEVFLAAGIPESYGYKLITEEKHTRQRDVILRLCLGAHFNVRETNHALQLAGMAPLYPKQAKDAILIIAINHGRFVMEDVQQMLESHGEARLRECRKEE